MQETDYYRHARPEMRAFLPTRYTRVLEVGCAEGRFRGALAPESEVWGCEANSAAAAMAARVMSRVLIGDYAVVESQIPDDSFDLVICNDVIEHMSDHDWFLDSVRRKLRVGGYLVGSVPNVRHVRNLYRLLLLKDWRYEDELVLDRTHLRFFTEKSLRRSLDSHGFCVEVCVGINETRKALNKALLFAFNVVTFWRQRDIEFPQIAFRAVKS